MKVSMRHLMALAMAGTMTLMAGCSQASSSATGSSDTQSASGESGAEKTASGDKTVIEYWHCNAETQGGLVVDDLVKKFNEENDHIEVVAKYNPDMYKGLMQNLQAEAATGNTPALVQIGWAFLDYFSNNFDYVAPQDAIDKFDSEDANFLTDNFLPNVLDLAVNSNGEQVGIPYSLSSPVLYINKDLLKEAGLSEDGPETWQEVQEFAETVKEKTGKYPKAIIPVALYGMPYDCEKIMAIADKYGIPVIEDAAEGMGSRFNGQVLGTFGRFGVLSFNGNKMITTSGGGALICRNDEDANNVMWHATQARDAYPYYQHTEIGYNYRMSNVCAGIGRGQMTVLDDHIAHHKHVQSLYEELLKDIPGIHIHKQPADPRYDANFWLCAATIDTDVEVKGQENAYKEVIKTAVGGAAGVIKAVDSAITDCQPNENVEALRVFMLEKKVEWRPVWKPMHKQPVYADAVAYVNGVSEEIFKVGFCLPSGPYVTDDDVRYIVECIKEAIEK